MLSIYQNISKLSHLEKKIKMTRHEEWLYNVELISIYLLTYRLKRLGIVNKAPTRAYYIINCNELIPILRWERVSKLTMAWLTGCVPGLPVLFKANCQISKFNYNIMHREIWNIKNKEVIRNIELMNSIKRAKRLNFSKLFPIRFYKWQIDYLFLKKANLAAGLCRWGCSGIHTREIKRKSITLKDVSTAGLVCNRGGSRKERGKMQGKYSLSGTNGPGQTKYKSLKRR